MSKGVFGALALGVLSTLVSGSTWAAHESTSGKVKKEVLTMLGVLGKLEKRGAYVFDPEALHEISKKGIGLAPEQAFDAVQAELIRRYPGKVADTRRWIFNVAGGAMGQLTVLYCSANEYLIFFGAPIGTEGFSGRFKGTDVYDSVFNGTMLTYKAGEHEASVFGPGSMSHLEAGQGWMYKLPERAYMLEYARGNILGAMKFGIYASTANVTLDWQSAWEQVHDCGKIALKEIFGGKAPRSPLFD